MIDRIEQGFMAFIAEGVEGIGAIREIKRDAVIVFVENAGEFLVPQTAIKAVHDQKVILDPKKLDKALLAAVGHAHDREDPNLVG